MNRPPAAGLQEQAGGKAGPGPRIRWSLRVNGVLGMRNRGKLGRNTDIGSTTARAGEGRRAIHLEMVT